jgi:hypothetical protein
VSSNTGENARKLRRPASRRSAPRRAPARVSGSVPCDGRYLDHEASRLALTCPRRAVIRRSGAVPSPGSGPFVPGRYQRMSVDRASGEPKKRRCSPAGTRKRPGGVDRAEAGGRAVKRAAAGGRMTARWSGVEPRTARWPHLSSPRLGLSSQRLGLRIASRRPSPQAPTPGAVGLLTAAGGQSPEVMSISSARDVNVGCRSGEVTS